MKALAVAQAAQKDEDTKGSGIVVAATARVVTYNYDKLEATLLKLYLRQQLRGLLQALSSGCNRRYTTKRTEYCNK